jgi:hypothetical protein
MRGYWPVPWVGRVIPGFRKKLVPREAFKAGALSNPIQSVDSSQLRLLINALYPSGDPLDLLCSSRIRNNYALYIDCHASQKALRAAFKDWLRTHCPKDGTGNDGPGKKRKDVWVALKRLAAFRLHRALAAEGWERPKEIWAEAQKIITNHIGDNSEKGHHVVLPIYKRDKDWSRDVANATKLLEERFSFSRENDWVQKAKSDPLRGMVAQGETIPLPLFSEGD